MDTEDIQKIRKIVHKADGTCDKAKQEGTFKDNTITVKDVITLVEESGGDINDENFILGKASAFVPGFSEDDDMEEFCDKIEQASYALIASSHPCPNVGNFQYDPTYCDPGYWCGCSDVSTENCLPSNDTKATFWAGQYTNNNVTTTTYKAGTNVSFDVHNVSKVYVGWAQKFPDGFFKCNNTLFCPGRFVDIEHPNPILTEKDCPNLCEKGYYCPDPTKKIVCPVGSYCHTGSIKPTQCKGIDRCNEEGLWEPKREYYIIIVALVALIFFGCVVFAYRYLNKLFPFRNDDDDEDDDDHEYENNCNSNNNNEFNQNNVFGHETSITKVQTQNNNTGVRKRGTLGIRSSVAPSPRRLVKHSIAKEKTEMKLMKRKSRITIPKPSYTIDIQFNDLQLTLKSGVTIMKGVTGELKSGQFTAIMGPSGAGKSTFLSLLSGKTEPTGGLLAVNGEVASLKDFRELVGFVPQEDIMLRELTVEENITHSALMRLPSDFSYEEKMKRVHKVMESLDLLHIRNSIIGDELVRGVSGGQRKRVNVAMELVANPSLLALDEPTSGLDSTTSSKLCETLSILASTNVNVMAVIHQPKMEILEKFTDVLLLGVGGKTVYMGPTEEMIPYFSGIGFPCPANLNPADFYMDVIAGLIPCETNENFDKEDLFDLWANSSYNLANSSNNHGLKESDETDMIRAEKASNAFPHKKVKYRETSGVFGQTYILLKRAILQRLRVPRNTLIPLILSAGAASLIGYYTITIQMLYYGLPTVAWSNSTLLKASHEFMYMFPLPPISSIPNVWLFTALSIMLICIVSLNTFGSEQAVILRDSFSGTSPVSYWFAKSFEAGLWLPLHAAVFVSVQCAFQSLPISVLNYWIVVWMAMLGFSGIGHIVSLLVGQTNRGIVHMICCLLLIMMFSGVMIKYNGNKLFTIFFTYWTAQGYVEQSLHPFEDVFEVDLYNDKFQKYNLEYSFGFNMILAALTSLFWHFIVLFILIYRMR